MNNNNKAIEAELRDIIETLDERIESLTRSIKNEPNQSVKKLMQDNYVLNTSLRAKYAGKLKELK